MTWMTPSYCQQADTTNNKAPEFEAKRIFWIIPNFRMSPTLVPYKPITAAEKFHIATLDSFDRGTFALGALFGAEAQLTKANPSFGQGVPGYAHYFATAYADYAIGDYMTEAIFPSMLHQDPRQILWTHGDSDHGEFHVSEIAGNSTAGAISMAYFPDNSTAPDAVSKLGSQLGVDMTSNILKEFWSDLERRFSRKHKSPRD